MRPPRRWIIAQSSDAARQLADCLKTSPLIAQMLINRGITIPDDCRKFLSPTLKDLFEPETLPNLAPSAQRLSKAIRDGEKIVIYGDYDVDGITATAILWHAIHQLGGQCDYYIPHRVEEGYGLNADAITQICDAGAKLIVTVDCGITAIHEARVAREKGVDLIITDHHEWKHDPSGTPLLPDCFSIVHPRLPDASYPNPHLCGAGVAFKLAWGLGKAHASAARVSDSFRKYLIDATALAALGTIADVVPLQGENRLLAHFGLTGLKRSQLTGLQALIESANLTGQKLDSYHVGFLLAPRLNASGRMGHAREAVEMLTRADSTKAKEIAAWLEQQNRSRQATERKIFDEAMAQVAELGMEKDHCRGVVLGKEGWHPGVIGIVASRVVSKLNKPVVMVALSNGHGQGSARSIPGFHLAQALDACREHLEACGGHEMAAGLRLETARFADFRDAFAAHARQHITDEMLLPELRIDCAAELRQINQALVHDLSRLGPFGTANPKPLLCCTNVELAAPPRRVGVNGQHAQLLVRQGPVTLKCIAFNRSDLLASLSPGQKLDLAAEPQINEYNGSRSVELEIRDVRIPR